MTTYLIHEANIERLRKKVNRIKEKCEKYSCPFIYNEIGEEFKTIRENGKNIVVRYIKVEAEGTAIVNNWEFVGTINHESKGNIIRKMKSEIEVPERYYNTSPVCEHCGTNRYRRETYLIHNKENDQIGRASCRERV